MTQRILVTGAQGLVGAALVAEALARGVVVRASTRRARTSADPRLEYISTGELTPDTVWTGAVENIESVIHCAARVHIMRENTADPSQAFRAVNTAGTLNLARQAAAAGARRFVFISSIKVNGEFSPAKQAFSERDPAAPQDAYGASKYEAEVGLQQIAAQTGMQVVIIRPPLIYGAGVKANFAALIRAVRRGMPLPFGAVNNQRSLVALENLVDFILTCLSHPGAANQTFLVSDGCDMSTAELVRRLARAAGVPARLVPVPMWVLRFAAATVGRRDVLHRVCGNLQVDISKARSVLGWNPPCSVDQALLRTVAGTGK